MAGSGGWAAVKTPQLHAMVRKYIDLYIRDEIPGYEEKSARFRYLFGRLRTTAEDIVDRMAEELAESDFKPVAFELGFGGGISSGLFGLGGFLGLGRLLSLLAAARQDATTPSRRTATFTYMTY